MRVLAKVLVANRGEIARRVLRTCASLEISTVAVYSDADAGEPHVREADEAVRIGPAPAEQSYLDVRAIVDAAVTTGAEAIHPGYGFLAESPALAEACAAKGITFIGPSAETIRLMADKAAAKAHLARAGVPVIPGSAELEDLARAREVAEEIGLPVLVKAVAGGGGKGMRRVETATELDEAVDGVRREALAAFGDDRVMLEKVVAGARHVEVQVFGDTHGEVIHLFERECSVQRRHQKVIEETPSPALDDDLRDQMTRAAVDAARAVGYVGAGTVEMLLAPATGAFYFLEMNTRLQVEHPVTELVTGLDLVAWQLAVAAGEPLPLRQQDVQTSGHALEARLYAEDPAAGFLPQIGRILVFDVPDRPWLRVDSAVEPGSEVTQHYDPMIAKVVTHGGDRESARTRLATALAEIRALGVGTNAEHLRAIIEHPAFTAGETTTSFLDDHLPDWEQAPPTPAITAAAIVGMLVLRGEGGSSPWERIGPWRAASGGWTVTLRSASSEQSFVVQAAPDGTLRIQAPAGTVRASLRSVTRLQGPAPAATLELLIDAEVVAATVALATDHDGIWVHADGVTRSLRLVPATRHVDPGMLDAGAALTSPMPGAVAAITVEVGDVVQAGRTLVVVEAMKMEHPVKAPVGGRVTAVHVAVGDPVEAEAPLVEVEPQGSSEGDT